MRIYVGKLGAGEETNFLINTQAHTRVKDREKMTLTSGHKLKQAHQTLTIHQKIKILGVIP